MSLTNWFYVVSSDLSRIPDAVAFYEKEYEEGRKFLPLEGAISRKCGQLATVVDKYYAYYQEIEAILEHLNIEQKKVRAQVFKKYLENYQRSLSSRDCEKYCDGDPAVINVAMLVNEWSLVRNKYQGLHKSLENMNWMIGHVVRLRAAGLDDAHF
ncbi:MAG: hypothetical protein CMN60_20345 [Sphingobium sp.]|nr:hypothetical protein [Sphingobium sp.]|tara:strand:+ start:9661 stop:10125 length:465 start_codon:yes stop_codon:yes gene_type:complete